MRIYLFASHVLLATNKDYASRIRDGVAEAIQKALPLLSYLSSKADITVVADSEASVPVMLSECCEVRLFDEISDLYDFTESQPPALAIFWNGGDYSSHVYETWVRSFGGESLYLEYGFYSQGGHVRLDVGGVLSAADLPDKMMYAMIDDGEVAQYLASVRVAVDKASYPPGKKPLLVLQTDHDSSVVLGSAFPRSIDFVRFLKESAFNFEECVVRFHPKMPKSSVDELMIVFGDGVTVDSSANPMESLRRHDLFIGVNSTLLYEAALLGKRVVNFGAMYGGRLLGVPGRQFLSQDFDWSQWQADALQRDRFIYFCHRYRQFSIADGLNELNRRYVDEALLSIEARSRRRLAPSLIAGHDALVNRPVS